MLNGLIRFALTHRPLIILGCLLVLVGGGWLATTLPIDVFPDLDRPRVVVLTECPGLSSEEVEQQVTWPLETALLGASGVEAVRSQSSQDISVIYVEFSWRTNIRDARQVVMERIAGVALPPGMRPYMTPPASIMGQIMHVGLHRLTGPHGGVLAVVGSTGLLAERIESPGAFEITLWQPVDRRDPTTWQPVALESVAWDMDEPPGRAAILTWDGQSHPVRFLTPLEQRLDLRTTADWIIRPRLRKIPGVAEIIIMGGDKKQYQVLLHPNKLLDYDVSLLDVEQAIRANNLNASGGLLEDDQRERPVRVLGRLGPHPQQVLEELRQIPVKTTGERPVLLRHLAEIVEGAAPKRGDAGVDGHDGVVLTIVKQPHADTRAVTDQVLAALDEIEQTLPPDRVVQTELFQLRRFIDRGIYYVKEALAIGAALVMIILVLFLLNLRTTFITLTAIPLSLVITTLVFRLVEVVTGTPVSINVMTLGGIAVAIGELVDDAIVDVENIFRRLRENDALPQPRPAVLVVYEASREIRSAIVFGTTVVILAFAPLFALSGVEGRLFAPLGVAYIVSILASLLVSLTVTPVLSYYLLPSAKATHERRDGWLLRILKWAAQYLIRFSLRFGGWIWLGTMLLVALSAWKLAHLGADFLPKFDEGSVQLNVTLPSGSSLKASNDAAALIDKRLRQYQKSTNHPDGPVLHFVRRTGRAERDEHAEPVSQSEYILSMNPASTYRRDDFIRELLSQLRQDIPGIEVDAEQPLSHLISHMLSGVNAHVAIKIYGDDLDRIRTLAEQVRRAIADVPGVTPPIIDPQSRVDEVHVVLRAEDLAAYGLSREYVAQVVQTALKGEAVTEVLEGQRRFDLVLKLQEPYRSDPNHLADLRIDLPGKKGQIRLRDVADLPDSASGPNLINRENVRRRQTVRCNVMGRDLQTAVQEIQQRVREKVSLPESYFIEFGGQFEAQQSATRLIVVLAGVSLGAIFIVLLMLFPSPRITLQILNAIPTAFIGGVWALVISGQTLTVASLVGFVSLGGIAIRNGILLVTHYFHLMTEEGEGFTERMILRGSLERLAPVLMTALTAGIALVPLVVGGRKPGLEILYPVATVILGGLTTSTFCEFLIHPGLFWKFSGKDAERLARKTGSDADLFRRAKLEEAGHASPALIVNT
jgi:HME family heavy-metal exporter